MGIKIINTSVYEINLTAGFFKIHVLTSVSNSGSSKIALKDVRSMYNGYIVLP